MFVQGELERIAVQVLHVCLKKCILTHQKREKPNYGIFWVDSSTGADSTLGADSSTGANSNWNRLPFWFDSRSDSKTIGIDPPDRPTGRACPLFLDLKCRENLFYSSLIDFIAQKFAPCSDIDGTTFIQHIHSYPPHIQTHECQSVPFLPWL